MGSFKMVCIDIDGTLVNSNHQVSPFTKKVIKNVATNHVALIVLVSARPPKSIQHIISNELNLTMPYIAYNGAIVMESSADTKYLYERSISLGIASEIYDHIKRFNISLNLYDHSRWYVNRMDSFTEIESGISLVKPIQSDFDLLIDSWDGQKGPHKILGMGEEHVIQQLEVELLEKYRDVLTIYRSKPTYLEIIDKRCSKTEAIKFLIDHLGIKQSEVLAFGDSYNDIDMLKFAGYGIAMGNAPREVKESANYITDSHDEHGVAKALLKRFPVPASR